MKAIVNIGLLFQRIQEKGLHGFCDAAAVCRTSPKNFQKLTRGEVPRADALQRICRGLGISAPDLIAGPVKPRPEELAEVIELKKVVANPS